ncbi:MAG: alpha/beta hydrolase [Gloeotrichia echinulata HAB0833]
MAQQKYLPIIFVRGYAGTQNDVETGVDDPFYGFNSGSSHVRVGEKGDPQKFFFESPLLRLMTDHGYQAILENNQLNSNPKSIYIYRFYDITSQSFGSSTPIRLEMEEIAKGLRDLIKTVKQQTGANKIYLIAHSMGGLVCRSLIQKIYPENKEKAVDHIDKFFTYGTPHGGIYFQVGGGLIETLRDTFRLNNSDDFGPQRMYEYLTPQVKPGAPLDPKFDPQNLAGAFPEDRVFCIIGTNSQDYGSMMGRVVGPQSDGLVQIAKAYVKGTHRAYIHRSHTGRYGMLNSEEGYQNLQRFLFGDIKVKLSLGNILLSNSDSTFYQMEVRVALRGLPIAIHEQAIAHYCPITLELTRSQPIPLFTAFLIPRYSASANNTCRYAIRLAIFSFKRKDQNSLYGDHIDQLPLWSDHLIVDVTATNNSYQAKYSWNSEISEPNVQLNSNAAIPLPQRGKQVLGAKALLQLEIANW